MRLLLILSVFFLSLFSHAQEPWVNSDSIAIEGYDVVAYFVDDKAKQGVVSIQTEWDGVIWQFSSEKNKELFLQNPAAYTPQFAGYCANGLTQGHLIEANPKNWRIHEGKLYLYYSAFGRLSWSTNIEEKLQKAKETWAQLKP